MVIRSVSVLEDLNETYTVGLAKAKWRIRRNMEGFRVCI